MLKGRRILVTGAGGGIGGATVRLLAEAGAEVVAADRTDQSVACAVTDFGAEALTFDLGSEESVRGAVGDLELDGLVNCAGYGGEISELVTSDITAFDRAVSVNARGALLVTKHAAGSMIRRGGGAVVNVSSQASLVALHGHVTYAPSKSALDAITRIAALELGPHGIRVNSVHPTVVMTEMSASYWGRPEIGGPYLADMPLGRWATVDDIAGPIVFLLGDGASMISGVCLPVDGGYTAR
ncbi:Diacetyl/L-xylulose reductase [Pseudonocardia sp. Ae717_Ps2]|uniref:SDR family oxidoreductase n=1 Tax=Pseudonocardia sp. Ae717_Ps2 TaxID=1885573 RepID=UPI00094AA67A|nr:SDR family oxidoreductase [Pseudonocardia sp. Ae717_Ps2]OLM28573.1 Diacetyl/L-xylulose reductase [Pseudonocardia sp. Ae717_Ps2]